jgi:hypothetical protein
MKTHLIFVSAIAIFLTTGFVGAALTQPAPNSGANTTAPNVVVPSATSPQTASQSAYQDQGFLPGFDDLMTMLVQPRHTKLYYAGIAKNWELAAAESRDLRSSFDRITQAIPNYEGNDVDKAVVSFIKPKIDAIDVAIAAADSKRFANSYKDLTAGCNACHTYMEHPFLVIKAPNPANGSTYMDQEFKPAPSTKP